MAVDRLERLTNLVAFLLHAERPVTLAEVVDQVPGYPSGADARRQAFERDKRVLRDERIPLTEDGGRYRIKPADYYLAPLDLDEAERVALQVAVAGVTVGQGDGLAGLRKLGGLETALAQPTPIRADLAEQPSLPMLHAAARARAVVSFAYGGQARSVEPWGLVFRGGRWYLVGHDRQRQARRTFRVDRIEGDPVAGPGAAFERPPRAEVSSALAREPWVGDGEEAVTAVVHVDALLAGRAAAELGERATVERRADGSVVLSFPVTNRAVFRSWLLDLLDHAEVLAPPDLRAEIVAWLTAMAAR
ncbi:MAG: helix-turn-helix transcriptional regulator [Acidimicrobiales bacterium]